MTAFATVGECWRYPVKSFQGSPVEQLEVSSFGVQGDRYRALMDLETNRILSAKRLGHMLLAIADELGVTLPDGRVVEYDDPQISELLSEWLGRPVRLCTTDEIPDLGIEQLTYEMTFDPPDDSSEYYDIPMPPGSFLDLAPLHIMTTATLAACESHRPDLNWDVRRFRPNLLVDIDAEPYVEDSWVGKPIRIGDELVVEVHQATVRCAMPLRPQPALGPERAALDREPELYRAMNDLRPEMANHLGVYVNVTTPGTVRVGDSLSFVV
ncbi:MAG TPA: MOSC domain-containing protein [Microthrixaceae bacterium]|nr:MOSC domain-containing protein [Microthrixaceae bacterium]